MTDHRLIELSQILPIDNLSMLIAELTRASPNQKTIVKRDFEDFLVSYKIPEVCSMLVQIIVDKDATYLVSRRVEEIFKIKYGQMF